LIKLFLFQHINQPILFSISSQCKSVPLRCLHCTRPSSLPGFFSSMWNTTTPEVCW